MARNGSGQFDLLVNSWNPATNGVLATAGDWQSLINDIAAALTQSVSRDGQAPMTGNLALGNNKITGLSQGTGTGQALAFEQLFSQGVMSDLASAATTDIGLQNTNFLRITGNTTITSFGSNFRGPRFLVFEGAVTLTNSSTLVLPGGANITTAAGDVLIAIPGATLGTADKWIVAAYQAATGYLKSNNPSYTGTLTGGTGVVNLGSGQFYKDASGNVGIGVTPSAWGVLKALQLPGGSLAGLDSTGNRQINVVNNVYFDGSNFRYVGTDPATRYAQNSGVHHWYSAPSGTAGNAISFTQAMTLDSSGNLLVGTTLPFNPLQGFSLYAAAGSQLHVGHPTGTVSGTAYFVCNFNGVNIGSISQNGTSGVSYNTSSDYRLKHDIQPMTGALEKVAALKPVTYKWKSDGSDGEGFIAHELAEVCPDAVTGEKDAVDADGKPVYQGIDTSFLVATLTAAIQEQQAIITAQAAQIQQLREKVLEVEEGISNMLVENTNNLYETITALTARVAALEAA